MYSSNPRTVLAMPSHLMDNTAAPQGNSEIKTRAILWNHRNPCRQLAASNAGRK
jgi:hypothetical protein